MWKKGMVWPEEVIQKRAAALRGQKRSAEARKKMSKAAIGRKLSAEAIKKRTETRRQNGWFKNPEATKLKMSRNNARALLGYTHTPEALAAKSEAMRGENNPNWQGGVTPINERLRKSLGYRQWRITVLARDDYTCQECGKRGGKLHADHIKPFALHPKLRFDVDNGRTLCIPCHRDTETWGYSSMYR